MSLLCVPTMVPSYLGLIFKIKPDFSHLTLHDYKFKLGLELENELKISGDQLPS